MFSEALKIADRNTVKYMIEELQDKATHEAELRKQTEENLQQETQRRKQAEENQKHETELRKQTEVKLQLSRENEQKLQEKIAELQSLLAEKN